MSFPFFLWSASEAAGSIRRKEISSREFVRSALDRVAELNPSLNAIVREMADDALAGADEADRAVRGGSPVGLLHGVPVTIKVNVDQKGFATTNGVSAQKDAVAWTDSPQVANLKAAGAIVIGRTNTPAYSLRWFTDNDIHGRTVNPWDARATPGGSSGGAGVAVLTGMGAIGHGNDYGGSVRYPAYCCGVVGLRPTLGRVPAYTPSLKGERSITNQMMSVQGPLTRTVADARLALHVMARADARDPSWVPAPLSHDEPFRCGRRVALFRGPSTLDDGNEAALDKAARALEDAGWRVEEIAPPHFDEAAALWSSLVVNDLDHGLKAAIEAYGDEAVRRSVDHLRALAPKLDQTAYFAALARRYTIARDWSIFLNSYDILLLPTSFGPPFPVDLDTKSVADFDRILKDQAPLLATAMLGLPGLSVPTGLADGLPSGVQIVADRFREDLCLLAGEVIEQAVGTVWQKLPSNIRAAS